MRVPRLYVPEPLPADGEFELTGAPLKHGIKVLRLGKGAEVVLFDGSGHEWRGVLETVGKDTATVRLQDRQEAHREPPLRWELVQGISRGERMDYTLQKCVELGVREIHPVETRRSMVKLNDERAAKRIDHWSGVVVSATEQCGRTRVAPVNGIIPLDRFLAAPPAGQLLLLDPEGDCSLQDLPEQRPERVLLLAGPEGGFDSREREAAYKAGARGLRLGPRILRTETAAVVAAALLLNRWGDFV